MRNNGIFAFVIVLFSLLNLSATWNHNWGADILNEEDIEIEQNQETPTLHTVEGEDPHFESYNQWICLPLQQIQVGCFDESFSPAPEWTDENDESYGGSFYPTVFVTYDGHTYQFESVDRNSYETCKEKVGVWKSLLNNQEDACFFAAYWPSDERLAEKVPNGKESYWVSYGLKTKSGRFLESFYEQDEARSED